MLLSKRPQDSHTSKANDEAITGHVSAPDVDGCGHQSSASWNSHSYPDVYIQCRARSSACHKAVLASQLVVLESSSCTGALDMRPSAGTSAELTTFSVRAVGLAYSHPITTASVLR